MARPGRRARPARAASRRTPASSGLRRLFCLTFEVGFFADHGYAEIEEGVVVSADIYTELVRSPDEGVAEFLDLARVKQNTLGNTRMLKQL